MEQPSPTELDFNQPHRISERDLEAGKVELADYKAMFPEEEGRPVNSQDLVGSLNQFNETVANFLAAELAQIPDEVDKQRMADAVFTMYWMARFAHDPQNRLETAYNDNNQIAENKRIQLAEQVKV